MEEADTRVQNSEREYEKKKTNDEGTVEEWRTSGGSGKKKKLPISRDSLAS